MGEMMKPEIKLSRNIYEELAELSSEAPVLENQHGSLFASEALPAACIRLKVPREDYLQFLNGLPESEAAPAHKVIPVDHESFDVVINGYVVVTDGMVTLDGKKTTLL